MEDVIWSVSCTILIFGLQELFIGEHLKASGVIPLKHKMCGERGTTTWMKVTVHGPEPSPLWATPGLALMKPGF